MSIAMLQLCWPAQVSPAEKAVLMVFADAASDNGHCWLLVSSIAVKTCLGSRTITRAVTSLEARGYVRRELRLGRSSVFYLIPEAIKASVLPANEAECCPMTPANAASGGGQTPANLAGTPANAASGGGQTPANAAGTPANAAGTPANAAGTPANAAGVTLKEPLKNPQTPDAQSAGVWPGFDEFKASYPRNAAMSQAKKVWNKLKPSVALRAQIMQAVSSQRQSEQWLRNVVPHAATWLNQERWLDATQPAAPGGFTAETGGHRNCVTCGATGTVMVDQRWYCRQHNPNRG